MLPGLIRTAATPASIALQREARVEVDVGDHRDRRQPHDLPQRLGVLDLRHRAAHDLAAGDASAAICAVVAGTSWVGVSVIDWTTTGAPPPIATLPTLIDRVAGHQLAAPGAPMSFESPMKNSISTSAIPIAETRS